MSRRDHQKRTAALEQARREQAEQRSRSPQKLWVFAESPILWGAVGVIIGSIGSALSIQWCFVLAWILIAIAFVRAGFWNQGSLTRRFAGNSSACVLLALFMFAFWRELPKPKEQPTPDEIADAIVRRMGGPLKTQNQGQLVAPGSKPNPPTLVRVEVDSVAESIADKVLKRIVQQPR